MDVETIDHGARRRRGVISGSLAVAVVLVASVTAYFELSGSSSSSKGASHSVYPRAGFGGYTLAGPVHQIGAQWRVPQIASNSPSGEGSTWVGTDDGRKDPLFIQLGITEEADGSGSNSYELFWNDTAVSFHPQSLGEVEANDLVSVSMQQTKTGWLLNARDAELRLKRSKLIAFGVGDTFRLAEWLQEDPTSSAVAASDVPYPTMATVSFQRLLVNNREPTLSLQDAHALVTSGGAMTVPTALRHDAFTLVAPTGAAAQYLAIASTLNVSLTRFVAALATWPGLSRSEKLGVLHQLSSAYRTNGVRLRRDSWPAKVRSQILRLASLMQGAPSAIERWTASGMLTSGPSFRQLGAGLNLHGVSDSIRSTLGLPPV